MFNFNSFWNGVEKKDAVEERGFKAAAPEWVVSSEGVIVNKLYPCTSTQQCASGYACVNGYCVQLQYYEYGDGSSSSCGSGAEEGSLPPACNLGGYSSCQSEPNCGDGYDPTECCGSIFYTGVGGGLGIIALCNGKEKEGTRCNVFCTSYYEITGIVLSGCSDVIICNDGCTFCSSTTLYDATCQPLANAPCYCEQSRCGECEVCNTDTTSSDFGLCGISATGTDTCQICEEIEYKCPCGQVIGAAGCASEIVNARRKAIVNAAFRCEAEYPCNITRQLDGSLTTFDTGDPVTEDELIETCNNICSSEIYCHCDDECPPGYECYRGSLCRPIP